MLPLSGPEGSRAVRVNLPAELGGGFTMVVCQLDQQPTIRSFTAQVIGMCQATNTQLLEASDWGLSNPRYEDEDADAPLVFLHPDTAIELILAEQDDEPELDLNRLKAARAKPSPRQPSRLQPAVDADDEPSTNSVSRNGMTPSVAGPARLSRQPSFTRISSDDEQQAGQWVRLFKVVTGRGAEKEVRWSRDPSTVKSHFDPPEDAAACTADGYAIRAAQTTEAGQTTNHPTASRPHLPTASARSTPIPFRRLLLRPAHCTRWQPARPEPLQLLVLAVTDTQQAGEK